MKGILFRPEMIKAIAEGRKTVTRRVIKPQPFMSKGVFRWQPKRGIDINMTDHSDLAIPYARYQVGEVVYIKEVWYQDPSGGLWYRLDNDEWLQDHEDWGKPIFMPAWTARYFIEITDVRPERLQEITEEDAKAEGVGLQQLENTKTYYTGWFQGTWNPINRSYCWESNPWVWRYEFKRVNHVK